MPLSWKEFVVFTIIFNTNMTTWVNGEFLWGRRLFKGVIDFR